MGVSYNKFGHSIFFSPKNLYPSEPVSKWGQWDEWSTCTHTCGPGVKIRHRHCDIQNNKMCNGDTAESLVCKITECQAPMKNGQVGVRNQLPVTMAVREETLRPSWSSWTTWSSCSVTCGVGQSIRQRACEADTYSPELCREPREEIKECVLDSCLPGMYSTVNDDSDIFITSTF